MRSHRRIFGRSLVVAAAACAGLALSGAAAFAQDTIDVTIDFAKIMKLERPAKTLFIGNPAIADAGIPDPQRQTLLLTGKTAGTTNLIVLDDDDSEMLNVTLRVASDVQKLTTIFYGKDRQTFSCSPVCEQVISVGDEVAKFNAAKDQIQVRQQFQSGQ